MSLNPFHKRLAILAALIAFPLIFTGCATNEYCLQGCPSEPAPAPVDSDGDGVTDDLDKCPGTPAGVAVDQDGCPIDSDGDGVPDYLDKCPRTEAGVEVDENGCPLPGPFAFQNVFFPFDSSLLTPEARTTLDETVDIMRSRPELVLDLQGHASAEGTDAYNLALSQRRAQSVHDYLTARGIASNRLKTTGFGETRPDASNATEAGRAKNRRVEFIVLDR